MPEKKKKTAASKSAEDIALKEQQAEIFELIRLRNHYYRSNYRHLIALLLFLLVILLVTVFTIYYMYSHRPEPQYYATKISGGITRLHPISTGNV